MTPVAALRRILPVGLLAALAGVVMFVLGPEYSLFAALGLVALILLSRWPVVGLYLIVVLVPFNGVITQLLGVGTTATAYGAIKDALLLGLLMIAVVSGRIRRVPGWLVGLVVLLVTVPFIASVYTPSVGQALYGWRNDYEPLLLLIVVPALLERTQITRLLGVFVATMQAAAVVALVTWEMGVQWLLDIGILPVRQGEDFPTSLFTAGSDRPRAFSPFVGPNELAVVMAATVAVIWLLPALRGRYRILLSMLPLVAVLLSESRSGIIGSIVVVSVLIAHGIHRRSPLLTGGFVIVAVVSVVAGAFLYITNQLGSDGDPSVGGHSLSLESGLQTMVQNPLGLGLGVVGPRAEQYEGSYRVESFLLLLALESGIVVLLIYLLLLVRIAGISLRANGGVGFLSLAVLAASAMSQLVLPTFQEGAVSFLVWLLVAVGVVAAKDVRSASSGEEPPLTPRRRVSPMRGAGSASLARTAGPTAARPSRLRPRL